MVAEGKAAPKDVLDDPEDAPFQFAMSEGFDRMNVLTANWGSGKSNRGGLLWEPPMALPSEVLARRSADPARLTREVKRVARYCGAALVGVAPMDARWLYVDVQRNQSSAEPSIRKAIRIADVPAPEETDDALLIPKTLRNVVMMAVRMDREMIATAPSLLSEAATSLGYSDAARACISVAAYIRALGYNAIPSLNGTALSIPLAVQAGLGELGRNGMLVTPSYGACVRLCKVFTDMPLNPDSPRDLGIRAYCQSCGECARHCPAQAIPGGEPTYTGHNACNNDGVSKWHVDAMRCLRYWTASGTSCSACIARCPFTLGRHWWWGLPQQVIARTSRLNRALVWLDRRTEARKRVEAKGFLRG